MATDVAFPSLEIAGSKEANKKTNRKSVPQERIARKETIRIILCRREPILITNKKLKKTSEIV